MYMVMRNLLVMNSSEVSVLLCMVLCQVICVFGKKWYIVLNVIYSISVVVVFFSVSQLRLLLGIMRLIKVVSVNEIMIRNFMFISMLIVWVCVSSQLVIVLFGCVVMFYIWLSVFCICVNIVEVLNRVMFSLTRLSRCLSCGCLCVLWIISCVVVVLLLLMMVVMVWVSCCFIFGCIVDIVYRNSMSIGVKENVEQKVSVVVWVKSLLFQKLENIFWIR